MSAIKKSTLVRSKPLNPGKISAKVKDKPGIYNQAYIRGVTPITRNKILERHRERKFRSIFMLYTIIRKIFFQIETALKSMFLYFTDFLLREKD